MAWIESHQSLAIHPKTRRAARLLGVSVPTVIGHLQLLWYWAMDYADDGDLSDFDRIDIAEAAMWDGDPDAFVDALIACAPAGRSGFLETNDAGRLVIHHWNDYAGKLIARRKKDAERKQRERHADETTVTADKDIPSGGCPEDVQRTDAGRRKDGVRNRTLTVPNPVLDANASRTGGGDAASESKVEPSRSRARDRGWEILVGFAGYEPKTRAERNGWNGVLKRLRSELHITDDDLQDVCNAYVTRWPEMEPTPFALEKHYQRLRETKRGSPNGHTPPSEDTEYPVFDLSEYLRSESKP